LSVELIPYHKIFDGSMKRFLAVFLLTSFVVLSCSKRKELVEKKEPLRNRSAGFLLRKYDDNQFKFDWLGMKIDAEYSVMGESQGFKATIRMKRDSIIWISISPALGIEMIRMVVTEDSLKYLSKIPENKFYYLGQFEDINNLVGIGIDFDMLQDLLIGNALGLDKDEGKFRSETDNDNYLLISKYKRKVRRVVGVDDRKLEDDTIVVNPNDPRYQRSLRRVDEENDLIVSRYWLEPERFKLTKSVFNDLVRQRTMELRYSEFHQDSEQYYPAKCDLTLKNPTGDQEMNFEITKLSSGKSYDFPFDIPEDYIRKDSL
jgi:hypothetical protein